VLLLASIAHNERVAFIPYFVDEIDTSFFMMKKPNTIMAAGTSKNGNKGAEDVFGCATNAVAMNTIRNPNQMTGKTRL